MRKTAAIVAVIVIAVIVLFSAAVFYKRYEARRTHLRLEQQAAEVVWHEFLMQFQRDVRLGTTRSEVKKYLEAKKMPYADGRDIMVKLGEEPGDGFACDRWSVYARFEFRNASATDPAPQDALTAISLQRIGHCL